MNKWAPSRNDHYGISLVELFQIFLDERAAITGSISAAGPAPSCNPAKCRCKSGISLCDLPSTSFMGASSMKQHRDPGMDPDDGAEPSLPRLPHKTRGECLTRYITEFAGRHNVLHLGTVAQMTGLARALEDPRLRYDGLVNGNA